jgi:serine/threonine protein kinase/tetratricopeptide (TPR) repeat protein
VARLLEAGDRLGDWLIHDRHLGTWGVVYVVARQGDEGQRAWPGVYAAKTLRPRFADQADLVARFEHECYLWLSLGRYKHWVPLLTVDRFHGQTYAIAEYVPEVLLPNTLRRWLDARLLEPEIAVRFGVQICRALGRARERGLQAHQDLKPENIMITEHGTVKLTDWGLSRMPVQRKGLPSVGDFPFQQSSVTGDSTVHGSRPYAAPELYQPGGTPGPASDLYSLGVVLMEMLGGAAAPGMPSARIAELLAPVGEAPRRALSEVLAACLAPDPENRPHAIDELEWALCEAFEDLMGVPMEPAPPWEPESPRDQGTRSYALFMLGRLDEAMHEQTTMMQRLRAEQEQEEPAKPTVMLIDYKEHGFKMVVPNEVLQIVEGGVSALPGDPASWRHAISTHQLSGSFERALELCLSMLDRWPDDPEALVTAAQLCADTGRGQDGVAYLARAAALPATGPNEWRDISTLYTKAGDDAAALDAAARGVARYPNDAELLIQYGHLLAHRGDHRRALSRFEAATGAAPDNAMAWYNVGTTRFKLGDSAQAYAAFTRAVQLNPEFAQAFNSLGTVCMQAGRFQEAAGYFQRAIAADRDYARPHFNLGQIYELTGQPVRALAEYRMALSIDPRHLNAQRAVQRMEEG